MPAAVGSCGPGGDNEFLPLGAASYELVLSKVSILIHLMFRKVPGFQPAHTRRDSYGSE